jgi:hypothetical protein
MESGLLGNVPPLLKTALQQPIRASNRRKGARFTRSEGPEQPELEEPEREMYMNLNRFYSNFEIDDLEEMFKDRMNIRVEQILPELWRYQHYNFTPRSAIETYRQGPPIKRTLCFGLVCDYTYFNRLSKYEASLIVLTKLYKNELFANLNMQERGRRRELPGWITTGDPSNPISNNPRTRRERILQRLRNQDEPFLPSERTRNLVPVVVSGQLLPENAHEEGFSMPIPQAAPANIPGAPFPMRIKNQDERNKRLERKQDGLPTPEELEWMVEGLLGGAKTRRRKNRALTKKRKQRSK